MYENIILKKGERLLSLLCVLLWMIPIPSLGQNIIYEQPMFNSEESIIRHYKNDIDIRMEWFSYQYTGYQIFNYVDRSTGAAYFFPLSVDYGIHDFEILDGIVYFCGSYGSEAMFGYFDIDSAFFLNGDIHINIFSTPSTHDTLDYLYTFLRLDVYKVGGVVHLAMVGNGGYVTDSKTNYVAPTIADAWQTSPTNWNLDYVMDYPYNYEYHDIAVTDNYVVVVGQTHVAPYSNVSPEYITLHYKKPTSVLPSQSMFYTTGGSSPFNIPLYITDSALFIPSLKIHVVHTMLDGFASVCDAYKLATGSCYVVSFYTDPLTAANVRFLFQDNINHMHNIRYSATAKSLAGVTGYNYLYRFEPPFNTVKKVLVTGADFHLCNSLDSISGMSQFILSGARNDYSVAKQWLHDTYNYNDCIIQEELPTIGISNLQTVISLTQSTHNATPAQISLPVKVRSSEIVIDCK